jgi:hypothetical protein
MNQENYILNNINKMEPVADERKGLYLYVACYSSNSGTQEAFMAVTKAMLSNEVASEIENLGEQAFIFASDMPLQNIKEKLKHSKVPYLLIDLGASYDLEAIIGNLPNVSMEILKNISESKFSKEKTHLKRILENAVRDEKFELAAPLRDIANKQTNE